MCLMVHRKCISKYSKMLHRQDLRMLDISLHSLPLSNSQSSFLPPLSAIPLAVRTGPRYSFGLKDTLESCSSRLQYSLPQRSTYKHKCVCTYRQYQSAQTFFMQTNSDLSSLRIRHISTTITKNSSSQHPVQQLQKRARAFCCEHKQQTLPPEHVI